MWRAKDIAATSVRGAMTVYSFPLSSRTLLVVYSSVCDCGMQVPTMLVFGRAAEVRAANTIYLFDLYT